MGPAVASPRTARRMERLSGNPCRTQPAMWELEEAQETPLNLKQEKGVRKPIKMS